jgi:alpha-ketoglutarate-dependent taurine dioxygenase
MMTGVGQRAGSNFGSLKDVKRKLVKLSQASLVTTSSLEGEGPFPLAIEPNVENFNPVTWATHNRELVAQQLLQYGALLFRNFKLGSVEQFEQFARAITPDLLDYQERAAPRVRVHPNVFTSTEYPSDHHIPLHHEMSYSHNWPTRIWFYCVQPAAERGATPIADDRKVFDLIPARIKERFMQKKVMYVRNYGEGLDLSWQDAFQTAAPADVEAYCLRVGIEFEWRQGGRLHTRQVRQAVATHPQTGQTVWFNHAHMFHDSNLIPEMRASLTAEFKDDELPRNAFYGDGAPIEASVLNEIRDVYQQAAVIFKWQEDDLLLLDNFLASHGRESFVGPRKILVAMADLYTNSEL